MRNQPRKPRSQRQRLRRPIIQRRSGSASFPPPGQVQSFQVAPSVSVQVELTPEELDRFKVLAGNGLKGPSGLGAKDFLNALVEGKNPDAPTQNAWNDGTPAEQALIVQRVVNRYRAAARQQLQTEFPALSEAIKAGANYRAQQLQGQGR